MYSARLATDGWQRARHVAALMQAPTDAEAELVRLPRPLLFLYYPLRAARLAAKYGPRSLSWLRTGPEASSDSAPAGRD
jgi:hypothetical protein